MLGDRIEQRDGLEPVARRPGAGLLDRPAVVDRLLHAGHDQPLADLLDQAIAELEHFREVVAGVHMHDREREAGRAERLLGQAQEHERVLAAAEQQHRVLKFGRDLAEDVNRLGLEGLEVRELVVEVGSTGPHSWMPHSVFSSPAQRPSRPDPGRVHGWQPIEA